MTSRKLTHRRAFLKGGAAALAATTVFGRALGTEAPGRSGRQRLAVDNVCAWPKLTTLPDGTIAAAIFNHPSHQRAPGDIDLWVSEDGGKNWRYRGTPAKREPEGTRVNHAIGLAGNGDLLVIAGGKVFAQNKLVRPWVCRSKDGGKTWQVLEEAFPTGPDGLAFVPFGDIDKAADGALCVAAFVFRPREKPRRDTVCIVRSDDDGTTWYTSATMADRVHNETDICHLGDGHWLAAARSLVAPKDHPRGPRLPWMPPGCPGEPHALRYARRPGSRPRLPLLAPRPAARAPRPAPAARAPRPAPRAPRPAPRAQRPAARAPRPAPRAPRPAARGPRPTRGQPGR